MYNKAYQAIKTLVRTAKYYNVAASRSFFAMVIHPEARSEAGRLTSAK